MISYRTTQDCVGEVGSVAEPIVVDGGISMDEVKPDLSVVPSTVHPETGVLRISKGRVVAVIAGGMPNSSIDLGVKGRVRDAKDFTIMEDGSVGGSTIKVSAGVNPSGSSMRVGD